jgi:hypothetical protein
MITTNLAKKYSDNNRRQSDPVSARASLQLARCAGRYAKKNTEISHMGSHDG